MPKIKLNQNNIMEVFEKCQKKLEKPKIPDNRFVYVHIPKLKLTYKGRGRPRKEDYVNREEYIKTIKNFLTK